MIRFIILSILMFIALWVMLGFMAWDWNPSDWNPSGRGLLVFLWVLSSSILFNSRWIGVVK